MKKVFLSVLLLSFFLLPLKALAAVDITLTDKSTTTVKSVSLTVDSGTDALEGIQLTIEGSEDVTFSEVNSGTVVCSEFTPTLGTASIDFLCTFDEATVVDGIVANIIFTTESEDYSITVVEDTVDFGDATLGTVVNVGEVVTATEETTTTGTESESTTEDVALVSANTNDTSSSSSTFFGIDIMEYLPYILLGGSVILLISIVGVLLTRKKDDNVAEAPSQTEPTVESNTETQTVTKEPTLKDMVNSNNVAAAPVETPPMQAPMEQSMEQDDLKDLIAKENEPEVKMDIPTVPPVVEEAPDVTPPVTESPLEAPLSTPMTNNEMPEAIPVTNEHIAPTVPVTSAPETSNVEEKPIDLQQLVNNEIQQIPVGQMAEEAPVTQPVVENTPVTPVQQSEEELPPVPPQM